MSGIDSLPAMNNPEAASVTNATTRRGTSTLSLRYSGTYSSDAVSDCAGAVTLGLSLSPGKTKQY